MPPAVVAHAVGMIRRNMQEPFKTETDWIGAEDAGSTPSNLIRSNSELPMLMPRIPDRGRHLVALNQRQEHPRRNVDETLLIILNPTKLQNLQETSES